MIFKIDEKMQFFVDDKTCLSSKYVSREVIR